MIDFSIIQARDTRNSKKYSLKQMKKQHIVAMKQQEHVMNERNIMMETRSDFIVRYVSIILSFNETSRCA